MATLPGDRRFVGHVVRGLAAWLLATTMCGCGSSTHDAAGCTQNADCQDHEFCDWGPSHACGRDHSRGTCVPYEPGFCPELGFWVCGCDGVTYTNQCRTNTSALPIDYGGPCRPAGSFVSCNTSSDCPTDSEFSQYCVDDPRDTCVPSTTTTCPGVCVHGAYPCNEALACLSATSTSAIASPGTEACIAVKGCAGPDCSPGRCVYTTRATCTSSADCGSGELCLPELGGDPGPGRCPGVCVRP